MGFRVSGIGAYDFKGVGLQGLGLNGRGSLVRKDCAGLLRPQQRFVVLSGVLKAWGGRAWAGRCEDELSLSLSPSLSLRNPGSGQTVLLAGKPNKD